MITSKGHNMENYHFIYKTSLKTLLDRSEVFSVLRKTFPQIQSISIDLDDKQFYLNIETADRIENSIQQRMLEIGHRVAFVSMQRNSEPRPTGNFV